MALTVAEHLKRCFAMSKSDRVPAGTCTFRASNLEEAEAAPGRDAEMQAPDWPRNDDELLGCVHSVCFVVVVPDVA